MLDRRHRADLVVVAEGVGEERKFADAAPLRSRRVLLRPPSTADYDWIYRLWTDELTGFRWRGGGAISSLNDVISQLWAGSIAQFVLMTIEEPTKRVGLVQCYWADLNNGTANVGVIIDNAYQGAGWPFEGVALFVNYLFTNWNLRKLYFEGPEYTLSSVASIVGDLIHEERRLRMHDYYDGQYFDHLTLALYRNDFEQLGMVPRLIGNPRLAT